MHRYEDYDFESLYKKERDGIKKTRYLALMNLKEGYGKPFVAKFLKKKLQTVINWENRFFKNGLVGLDDEAGRGRKSKLANEDEAAFKEELEKMQKEKQGGRVIGKDIHKMLHEKFNAIYHEDSVYNLLKKLDLVWISARSRHPKSIPEDQENFKK